VSRLLQVALVSSVLAIVCIALVDEPLARWLATRETYPGFWNGTIALLEYPLGIEPYKWTGVWVLALGSVATLAVGRLRPCALPWILVTLVHLLGRNLTMWMKFGFGRLRPTQWLARGAEDSTWWHDNASSFPSGHVTLFASVVIPIVAVYPRAWPLLVFAVFPMLARVAVNAHFVSDVLAGLALIALITWLVAAALRRALSSQTPPVSRR
jgi:membrane-associated phospholipid phosphatase